MFSFTRFCLQVLADLNEIIRRMKRKVILKIAIILIYNELSLCFFINKRIRFNTGKIRCFKGNCFMGSQD